MMLKSMIVSAVAVLAVAASAETTAKVPDTQIAKILLTINDGEIDAAKVAKRHAQTQEIKDFANMMTDHHKKNMKETKEVAKKNAINPENCDAAKAMKDAAEQDVTDLKRQEKMAFDRAYIRQQIAMHERALATLNNTLIPSAQNPDFKAHLEKTQVAVSQHLAQAKAIESNMQ